MVVAATKSNMTAKHVVTFRGSSSQRRNLVALTGTKINEAKYRNTEYRQLLMKLGHPNQDGLSQATDPGLSQLGALEGMVRVTRGCHGVAGCGVQVMAVVTVFVEAIVR